MGIQILGDAVEFFRHRIARHRDSIDVVDACYVTEIGLGNLDDTFQLLILPPEKKLPAKVIADFERWISRGAIDPRIAAAVAPAAKKEID